MRPSQKRNPLQRRGESARLQRPSSTARALGWFSLALGTAEVIAPGVVTRALGLRGYEPLVRAFGLREIGHGALSLSSASRLGLLSRVAGDAIDVAAILPGLRADNPKRHNVVFALVMLAGVGIIDVLAAKEETLRSAHGDRAP